VHVPEKQLKNFIVDAGLVSEADFESATAEAKKQKRAVKTILVSKGYINEDELRRIEAQVLGIPFVSLKSQKIEFEVLSMIPEPIARNHNIVAFKKTDDALEVAMLDTDDLAAIDFVKKGCL